MDRTGQMMRTTTGRGDINSSHSSFPFGKQLTHARRYSAAHSDGEDRAISGSSQAALQPAGLKSPAIQRRSNTNFLRNRKVDSVERREASVVTK